LFPHGTFNPTNAAMSSGVTQGLKLNGSERTDTSLFRREVSSVFSKESGEKASAKGKSYEIKQLMKEKRSEEYEVLEETANMSRRF